MVLECDTERSELLAEEAQLMAALGLVSLAGLNPETLDPLRRGEGECTHCYPARDPAVVACWHVGMCACLVDVCMLG